MKFLVLAATVAVLAATSLTGASAQMMHHHYMHHHYTHHMMHHHMMMHHMMHH